MWEKRFKAIKQRFRGMKVALLSVDIFILLILRGNFLITKDNSYEESL